MNVDEESIVAEELDPVLMHPKRFLIVSLLYMLGPRTMSFIQKSLKMPWGPLYTHLKRLEEEGYIRSRKIITPFGPRTVIELTDKGLKAYHDLVAKLDKITSISRRRRGSLGVERDHSVEELSFGVSAHPQ